MSVFLYEALVKTRVRVKHPDYEISDHSIELLLEAARASIVSQLKGVHTETPKQAVQLLIEDEELNDAIINDLMPIMKLDWSVSIKVVEEITRTVVRSYGELLSMENYDSMRAVYGTIQAPPANLESTAEFIDACGYTYRLLEDTVEFITPAKGSRKSKKHYVSSIRDARLIITQERN